MAVLLDSPAWASRRTAGDRDGLPGDVLTRMMRWPSVQRVWLPAWLADRDAVLDKLESELAQAYEAAVSVSGPEDAAAAAAAAAGVTPEVVRSSGRRAAEPAVPLQPVHDHVLIASKDNPETGQGTLLEAVRVDPRPAAVASVTARPSYKPWTVQRFGGVEVLDTLHSRRSVAAVREAIRAVVEAEGPVHQERLAKLVCAAFELNKMNSQRANSVLDVMDESVHYPDSDGFIWDASVSRETWEQFRPNSAEVTRKPEHISVVEIRNAMVEIVRVTGGIAVDELHRETIRTFGGKRLTAGVTARLNQGLQYGVDTGRLELPGEFVQLAG